MGKKNTRFFIIVVVMVILDQLTKIWIHANFSLYQSKEIISGVFNLTYLQNPGAAFGFLANTNRAWVPVFFVLIGVLALVVILFIFKELNESELLPQLSFALIFGGALGNLIDRIFRGKVIDFLDFCWGQYHWPAFNIADSCITVGVALYILSQIIGSMNGTEKSTITDANSSTVRQNKNQG